MAHLHLTIRQNDAADCVLVGGAKDKLHILMLGQNTLGDIREDGGGLNHLVQILLAAGQAGCCQSGVLGKCRTG